MGKFLAKWSHWGENVRQAELIMESLTGEIKSHIDFNCYVNNEGIRITKQEAKDELKTILNLKYICTANINDKLNVKSLTGLASNHA